MAGVDLKTVQELIGHKDIEITLRYSHLAVAHKAQAVKLLDSVTKSVTVISKFDGR